MSELKDEFEYYEANKADFLSKYRGRFIVLKDHKLLGVYDDRLEAINTTAKNEKLGTFLVQQVVESEDQVRFHSRYAISQ